MRGSREVCSTGDESAADVQIVAQLKREQKWQLGSAPCTSNSRGYTPKLHVVSTASVND